eukprot:38208-Hanusia_phi.AAC.1
MTRGEILNRGGLAEAGGGKGGRRARIGISRAGNRHLTQRTENPGQDHGPRPRNCEWEEEIASSADWEVSYEKRSAVAEALKSASNKTEKLVSWTPRANRPAKIIETACPALQDMCIDVVATHIEACLEFGLGSILPEMKAKICASLGRKRKLSPEILPIFTDQETSILALPDCSKIGEGDLEKAFERCQIVGIRARGLELGLLRQSFERSTAGEHHGAERLGAFVTEIVPDSWRLLPVIRCRNFKCRQGIAQVRSKEMANPPWKRAGIVFGDSTSMF